MRAFIAALLLALASTIVGATPAVADDVPRHLHCLTTPGTTTAIAGGLTANAPHDAFSGFHWHVHTEVLATRTNLQIRGSFTGSC